MNNLNQMKQFVIAHPRFSKFGFKIYNTFFGRNKFKLGKNNGFVVGGGIKSNKNLHIW